MALREQLEKQGQWIFKWRSYFPFIITPVCLIALRHSDYLERAVGPLAELLWEILCILISFTGLLLRCLTVGYVPKGTSGRNTQKQMADSLNTTGMYSVVRNPLYVSNFAMILGLLLFVEVWWFAVIGAIFFWFIYERIIFTEEEYLRKKFGEEFLAWADKTPVFIPHFKNWQKQSMSFSAKTVLRREHSTMFALVATFTVGEILGDLFSQGKIALEPRWVIFFFSGLIIYLLLRTLKKKTKLLNVEGR
jgi:protein-S-isoprenylcysteine O-methyltransferase Ste14